MTDRRMSLFILFPLAQLLFKYVFLFNLHSQFVCVCCTLRAAGLYQGYTATFSSYINTNAFTEQSIFCLFIPYNSVIMC